uniref:Uncharacterized protein n=1 Tax=Macrostomum lignano TaxID=282301 RepID=A0A1I8F4N6_9PLAT
MPLAAPRRPAVPASMAAGFLSPAFLAPTSLRYPKLRCAPVCHHAVALVGDRLGAVRHPGLHQQRGTRRKRTATSTAPARALTATWRIARHAADPPAVGQGSAGSSSDHLLSEFLRSALTDSLGLTKSGGPFCLRRPPPLPPTAAPSGTPSLRWTRRLASFPAAGCLIPMPVSPGPNGCVKSSFLTGARGCSSTRCWRSKLRLCGEALTCPMLTGAADRDNTPPQRQQHIYAEAFTAPRRQRPPST